MWWASLVLVAAAAGVVVGCSSEDAVAAGLNGACTRSRDCLAGLTCAGGVCTPLEAGTEGGATEGGVNASPLDGSDQ